LHERGGDRALYTIVIITDDSHDPCNAFLAQIINVLSQRINHWQ
jgi:hypothetical protein